MPLCLITNRTLDAHQERRKKIVRSLHLCQVVFENLSKLFRNVPFLTSLEMSPFVLVPLLFLVLLFFLLLALFFSLSLACPERSPASP